MSKSYQISNKIQYVCKILISALNLKTKKINQKYKHYKKLHNKMNKKYKLKKILHNKMNKKYKLKKKLHNKIIIKL